ncbi:MAG: hypothetical protein H0T11_07820 [Chthoniobacterales bacterium]|nr:hypothetical protein [Chthoniobacterales bacterium]
MPLPPVRFADAGGFAWHWYKRLGPYDTVAHGLTLFAITLSLGFLLYRRQLASLEQRRWLFIITFASFGIALGTLWKIVEWAVDQLFGTALAPSLSDTIIDLSVDAAGALGAALLANWGLPDHVAMTRQREYSGDDHTA